MKTSADDVSLLLFDLDGTLFRSTGILHEAYQAGIRRHREQTGETVRVPTEQDILSEVGNPVDEIYRALFPQLTSPSFQQLQNIILDQLVERIRQGGGELVDGVDEVLSELQVGFQLGLITNARRAYMEAVVESHGLGPFFDRMRCIEDVSEDDKAVLVREMIKHFQTKPTTTLVVGDRSSDRKAALAVGTQFLGCNYGYGDVEEFAEELRINQISQVLQYPPVRRAYVAQRLQPDG